MKTLFTIIFSLLLYATSHAYCFNEAGKMYNINSNLLWSIAKVESNFNQKAINKNSNGTYDIGVMQINSSWKSVIGDKNWKHITDPCYNIKVGAWVLANCIKRYGYTWEAVGCYNAKSKSKRDKYYRKVYYTLIRYSPQYAYKNTY